MLTQEVRPDDQITSKQHILTQSHDNPQISRVDTGALDKYNPFEATGDNKHGNHTTNSVPPPQYSATQAQKVTTAELERRQKELDAKAAELARREEEQRMREEQNRPVSQRGLSSFSLLSCPSSSAFNR
ncbi:unnamed protein product [Schistosoma mattheei]|uniref:Uncharacterized protein n=1 Tax=Schistosoma mattheei TaxID=31246 RepID=A0A183P5E4_9TREM|nr:unnamed protein product [Schistosoma mattheei]